jgi:hypothetical protein
MMDKLVFLFVEDSHTHKENLHREILQRLFRFSNDRYTDIDVFTYPNFDDALKHIERKKPVDIAVLDSALPSRRQLTEQGKLRLAYDLEREIANMYGDRPVLIWTAEADPLDMATHIDLRPFTKVVAKDSYPPVPGGMLENLIRDMLATAQQIRVKNISNLANICDFVDCCWQKIVTGNAQLGDVEAFKIQFEKLELNKLFPELAKNVDGAKDATDLKPIVDSINPIIHGAQLSTQIFHFLKRTGMFHLTHDNTKCCLRCLVSARRALNQMGIEEELKSEIGEWLDKFNCCQKDCEVMAKRKELLGRNMPGTPKDLTPKDLLRYHLSDVMSRAGWQLAGDSPKVDPKEISLFAPCITIEDLGRVSDYCELKRVIMMDANSNPLRLIVQSTRDDISPINYRMQGELSKSIRRLKRYFNYKLKRRDDKGYLDLLLGDHSVCFGCPDGTCAELDIYDKGTYLIICSFWGDDGSTMDERIALCNGTHL